MPYRRWTVLLEDDQHVIELRHGLVSGKREIRIDGQTVISTGWLWKIDLGSRHDFCIGPHGCVLTIGRRWEFGVGYGLRIDDGETIEPD